MASIHSQAKEAIRKLNADGQNFLADHDLFSETGDLPVTAAKLVELAQQVSDGKLSYDEADVIASQTVTDELNSKPEDEAKALAQRHFDDELDAMLDKAFA